MPDSKRYETALGRLFTVLAVLLVTLAVAVVVFLVTEFAIPDSGRNTGTTANQNADTTEQGSTAPHAPSGPVSGIPDPYAAVILTETPDAGIAYQDSLIFVGDSLTAHFRSRGVLTGGGDTKQVWCPESNTLNLNSEVVNAKIVYPGTGENMTIAAAAGRAKPAIMVINLGINWGVSYLSETDFKACYTALIKEIQKASPDTVILLQSIYPVTAECSACDNAKIDTANRWVKAVAFENNCRYLDTQVVLKNADNCLREDYAISDGIHLTTEAYAAILGYIRTHAVTD